jgi:AcrR family transcriptional regulator
VRDEPGTLRARKKVATRQALHEAALRLAMANGLDCVTVEHIADEAGVSRRTFSNYFANKEDAILHADRERTRQLLDLVASRPAEEPPWTALRHSALTQYDSRPVPNRTWLEQFRLLRKHPSLMARQAADQIAFERDLAETLQSRDPELTRQLARLTAATFLAILRTTGALWFEQPDAPPLPDLLTQLLDRVSIT